MLSWLLAAAVTSSQPIPEKGFKAPETLYEMSWDMPLVNNCWPIPMNAMFDELQGRINAADGRLMARVFGYYDGPAFVFLVMTGAKAGNGKFRTLERVYVSDPGFCRKRYLSYKEEAQAVADGGRPKLLPGYRDFTASALYFDGVRGRRPDQARKMQPQR